MFDEVIIVESYAVRHYGAILISIDRGLARRFTAVFLGLGLGP